MGRFVQNSYETVQAERIYRDHSCVNDYTDELEYSLKEQEISDRA